MEFGRLTGPLEVTVKAMLPIDDLAAVRPHPATGALVSTASAAVHTWRGGELHAAADTLIQEVPVALVFNGISHAVMLVTPEHLDDFALGFALSEGLLGNASELYGLEVQVQPEGVSVEMDVSSRAFESLKGRRRSLAGRTGCGLCGLESLQQVEPPLAVLPLAGDQALPASAIARALADLPSHQGLQQRTGASHAAAFCSAEGEVLLVREDVGRHNALDKLIGAMARARQLAHPGFVCITSRASVEMVRKAIAAGVHTLVAVSAPTARAAQTAQSHGLTLAGFARGSDLVLYAHPERIGFAQSAPFSAPTPHIE
jgi:FdhD protein